MAEAFAAVGIAASIVQLVDFGSKILRRLSEFQSALEEVPSTFRHLKAELPLLLDTLQQTKGEIDTDSIREETRIALLPVIEGCRVEIESLDALLTKTLPTPSDSWKTKSKKAIFSLAQDAKVEKITSAIRNYIQTLTHYHAHAAASCARQPLTDRTLLEIRQWLSPPDPFPDYHKALKQRLNHTGGWLVESEKFAKWKTDSSSFLWLYGIPGCGKSILSSTVIENITQECYHDPSKAVAFFYFKFDDSLKQVPELMIKSLICQLLQRCSKMSGTIESMFYSHGRGKRQPTLDALLKALRELIRELPISYVVLDALDECNDRTELLEILETIVRWDLTKLHIIVTSRRERDIEISLKPLIGEPSQICLQSKIIDNDIRTYVRHRLSVDKNLKRWQKNVDVHQEIETALMGKAHGMFRWAACQLDTLGKCLNVSMIRKALSNLPPTLDETYDRILCGIDNDYSEYALSVLQWLAFSARPLLLEAVAEVVAIRVEGDVGFDRDMVLPDPLDILSICSSLITITNKAKDEYDGGDLYESKENEEDEKHEEIEEDEEDEEHEEIEEGDELGEDEASEEEEEEEQEEEEEEEEEEDVPSESGKEVVILAHYSVKEYLISDRIQRGRAARYNFVESASNIFIAKSCLHYLLQFRDSDSLSKKTAKASKLAIYAAQFWSHHTKTAGNDTKSVNRLIMELFSLRDDAYLNSIRFCNLDTSWRDVDSSRTSGRIPNPLYYASLIGLPEIVGLLINKAEVDVNAKSGSYDYALVVASNYGQEKIVEQLLEAGADVNVKGGHFYGTALQGASSRGYVEVVERLLKAGADVNVQGGYFYGTALQGASSEGYVEVVERLLKAGADVNVQGGHFYGTALQVASSRGYIEVVERLLKAGADVNIQDGQCTSALENSVKRGDRTMIELLLRAGADINLLPEVKRDKMRRILRRRRQF